MIFLFLRTADAPETCATASTNDSAAGNNPVEKKDADQKFWFKKKTTSAELDQLSGKTFALNTDRKITWAVDLFKDWRKERVLNPECPTEILWCSLDDPTLNKSHLCRTLCSFVNEVRRKDGNEYPGKTLYDLILCLQFYLEKRGLFWKLIDDQEMVRLKFTLDNLMKKHCAERLGSTMSAQPITFEHEELLWEMGILGEQQPNQLRNTVLFLLGISFALHGGDEHRRLQCPGFEPQITVMKDEKGVKFLCFQEDLKTKTNQGGLSGKNFKARSLKVYGNQSNLDRDVVRLFEKYVGLLPQNPKCGAFYKYGLAYSSMRPCCWYSDKPVRVNSLKKVVSDMMKQAGIDGKFTNHSLRATTATHMFEKGVDEQLIKCVTGHKSDAVRLYKRPSDKLLKSACETVVSKNAPQKRKVKYSTNYVEPPEFDIDSYEIPVDSTVKYKLGEDECEATKSHKKNCPFVDESGECTGLCGLLKKIDQKASDKKKVKKLKLCVEYND